ncbi:hypothetical protein H2248_001383 [Termitomyces sp. 'cryptogamus']|nr:hypothetical protein H2248_001383 [Termitomyces sp. 'cryptogamus']
MTLTLHSKCRTTDQTSCPRTYFWNGLSWLATLCAEQGMVLNSSCMLPVSLFCGRREMNAFNTTFLITIETLFMIVQAKTVQDIYIDNRNYPGGPWAYFLATQCLQINVMFYATLSVFTFLSDLLIVWCSLSNELHS